MADMIRNAAANPFRDWMDRHKMSIQRTADALGCSTGAVQNWKRNGAPRYILMACMAYETIARAVDFILAEPAKA